MAELLRTVFCRSLEIDLDRAAVRFTEPGRTCLRPEGRWTFLVQTRRWGNGSSDLIEEEADVFTIRALGGMGDVGGGGAGAHGRTAAIAASIVSMPLLLIDVQATAAGLVLDPAILVVASAGARTRLSLGRPKRA